MAKQRIDDARGATYGAGVAIESDTFQIPPLIKEIEAKKKIQLKIDCPWPGCYKKGHKTNRAKGCKYYGKTDDDASILEMKEYLLEAYPEFYGELIAWTGRYIVCCSDLHPMVPTMLLQNCLLIFLDGFLVSSFAYYEQSF